MVIAINYYYFQKQNIIKSHYILADIKLQDSKIKTPREIMSDKLMLYGANGYTARLIIKELIGAGIKPVLAGRNQVKISALADKHGFDHSVFALDDTDVIGENLADVTVLINAAGPYSQTAKPFIDSCLRSKTHYIDITGEIDVFVYAESKNRDAEEAGIILCPGTGFDVIPTDCLSYLLKEKLPDATELNICFFSENGRPSIGTAKTSIEGLANGGRIRSNGIIEHVPLAHAVKEIDYGQGPKMAMSIPWGDVATAYYSTGIPNITVYTPRKQKGIDKIKRQRKWLFIMKLGIVQNFIKNKLDKKIVNGGDSDEKRTQSKMWVWAEVKNDSGQLYSGKFQVANGYDVTGFGAMAIAKYLLEKELAGGYYTPSKLMGPDILDSLPGFSGIEYSNN